MDYSVIDSEIRELCRAINETPYFETLSSCQGHYSDGDVEASTRSGAAGPYIIFGHDEPSQAPEVAAVLNEVDETVNALNKDLYHHDGFVVKQVYNDVDEAQLGGKSSFTVKNPYRPSTVPGDWEELLSGYGDAVELVLHTGDSEHTKLDHVSPDIDLTLDAPTHLSSVLDFQHFTDATVEELEHERNTIVSELETVFRQIDACPSD